LDKGKIYVEHESDYDEITYEGVGSTSVTGLTINHISSCFVKTTYMINDDGSIYYITEDGEYTKLK